MEFFIFILPVLAVIWLVVSIVKFCKTKKENAEERKSWKKQIIISASIIVAWIVILVGFCCLIMYSIMVNGM
jgi:heme/copper-type cytochrome/quinol oxidase subunit 2